MQILITDQMLKVFKHSIDGIDCLLKSLEKELGERKDPNDTVSKCCRMSMQDMEHEKFILKGIIEKYHQELKERNE